MSYQQDWNKYQEILEKFDYTEEQISAVKEIRENLDNCPYEQFIELVKQGVIVRTRKIRKPRNYYVNEEGQFLYLDHYWKAYNIAGYFKSEE